MEEKFWKELEALLDTAPTPPTGQGWFTVRDFAARYKLSDAAAVQRLKRMHANGAVEKQRLTKNGPAFYRPLRGEGK